MSDDSPVSFLLSFEYGIALWFLWILATLTAIAYSVVYPSLATNAAAYAMMFVAFVWMLAGANVGWLPRRI